MTDINDFYRYIEENYDQCRHEVMKNITYEEELFDEAFNDTVIKVADAINRRHKDIQDIRFYFFISCKQNYINLQNRKRKERAMLTGDLPYLEPDEEYSEERANNVNELFDRITEMLEERFPSNEVDLYVIYYKLKSSGEGVSYRKMAEIMGIPVKDVTLIIQRIKKFVRNDEEINRLKKELKL